MSDNELMNRITKLELDLREAQRNLTVREAELVAKVKTLSDRENEINELKSGQARQKNELEILKSQVASLTSDKEQLGQKIEQLKADRVRPTPTQLVQSFRLAMNDLQTSLTPTPGERVGYTVSRFDVDLKTAVSVDKKDGAVRFVLPEPGESIPPDQLSTVRFAFQTVPKAMPPDLSLVEVPALLGLSAETAEVALGEKGLKVGNKKEQESPSPPGTVIGQIPDGGDLVPPGSSVDITIAKKRQVTVPNLVGLMQTDAEAVISGAGLSFGSVAEKASTAPKGSVLSQTPPAKTQVDPGTQIDIVIAVPDLRTVPGVIHLKEPEAVEIIRKADLTVGQMERRPGRPESKGIVLEQTPGEGRRVPAGSSILLVIGAADRVKVPDVTKKLLAEAKEILTKASLKVGTITSRKHDLIEEIVLEQTPGAGTEVGSQTPINLVVARKGTFEDVLDAITKHKDIGKISIRAATLLDRLSTVGVDSLEKLAALETLSDLELRSRLNLRTLIGAQMLRKVIKAVTSTKGL